MTALALLVPLVIVLGGFLGLLAIYVFPHMNDSTDTEPTTNPSSTQTPPIISAAQKILNGANALLGKTAQEILINPQAPLQVRCAECVSHIVNAFAYPNFPIILSTDVLHETLLKDARFKESISPSPGCIIISPTQGTSIGHTGIYLGNNKIASHNSFTDLWEVNYTPESWVMAFHAKGLHTYIFEAL